ncbi:MAG: hypothetical protein HC927_01670 [Deltaproteobacteria bacterium]|nr:hypothetical protein [Deltaproteobacteria bacterium]
MKRSLAALVPLLPLLTACPNDDGDEDDVNDEGESGSESSSSESDSSSSSESDSSESESSETESSESESSESETGETDTSEADTSETETGEPEGDCFDGLPRRAFDTSATTVAYDRQAPDVVIDELRGPQRLSEFFTGCESHVFVIYSGSWWNSPIEELVDDSAPGTNYWFVDAAMGHDEAMRTVLVTSIAGRIEQYLEELGPQIHAEKTNQFHYVVTSGLDIPLVAEILAQNPGEEHFTVDREQLVREGHNVAVYSGSWVPLLAQTRYWAKYYGAQQRLDDGGPQRSGPAGHHHVALLHRLGVHGPELMRLGCAPLSSRKHVFWITTLSRPKIAHDADGPHGTPRPPYSHSHLPALEACESRPTVELCELWRVSSSPRSPTPPA